MMKDSTPPAGGSANAFTATAQQSPLSNFEEEEDHNAEEDAEDAEDEDDEEDLDNLLNGITNLEAEIARKRVLIAQARRKASVGTKRKRPPVILDVLNMAAKCIQAQSTEHKHWTLNDFDDDSVMSDRIMGSGLYIQIGAKSEVMKKFVKYFVKKTPLTTAQGDDLKNMIVRIFTKRKETKKGEKVTLDAYRRDFKRFIGNLMLGRIVNPLIPKHTGKSLQDYHNRIDVVARKIRQTFFGEDNETAFYYPAGDDGEDYKTIRLPTIEEIAQEITYKLLERENAEMKFLREYLLDYDIWLSRTAVSTPEEDEMHMSSRDIIDNYRMGKSMKGPGVPDGARGKRRLFSAFHLMEDPVSRTPTGSAGRSGSASSNSSASVSASSTPPASGASTGFIRTLSAAGSTGSVSASSTPASGASTGFIRTLSAAGSTGSVSSSATPASGTTSAFIRTLSATGSTGTVSSSTTPASGTSSAFIRTLSAAGSTAPVSSSTAVPPAKLGIAENQYHMWEEDDGEEEQDGEEEDYGDDNNNVFGGKQITATTRSRRMAALKASSSSGAAVKIVPTKSVSKKLEVTEQREEESQAVEKIDDLIALSECVDV